MADLAPLGAGLALTAAAILLARSRIAAAEREMRARAAPTDIVVAAAPISTGTAFTPDLLAKKSVPISGTGRRNVPAKDFELLLDARAKVDIAPGEPILWTDVAEPFDVERFSELIPDGQRAVTLQADVSASFAGLLRPGDKVDLLCERDGNGPTVGWIRNLPILAVDRNFDRPRAADEEADAATITVLVSPPEGSRLSSFLKSGRVRWFLRNPGDNTVSDPPRASTPQRAGLVEIWHAGIRLAPAGPAGAVESP